MIDFLTWVMKFWIGFAGLVALSLTTTIVVYGLIILADKAMKFLYKFDRRNK